MKEYGQLKGELEYLKSEATQMMKKIRDRSPLDAMIDKATGYDKAQARELTRILCRIGHRQKRLGEKKDRSVTSKMIKQLVEAKR